MDKNEFIRDYNVNDYIHEEDKRFHLARNEALFAQSLIIGSILIAFTLSYLLCPVDMSKMTYVFGLPLWFVAATSVFVATFILMVVYNSKFSKNIVLSPRSEKIIEEEDN